MQREVNMGLPFENRRHMNYSTSNHPTQLHAANDINCCFMAILSRGKPAGPRIVRKLWSNLMPGLSMNLREQIAELREQTADKKVRSTEDTSRERGEEVQLRMAAQRGLTEDATDPKVAPQDYDVSQTGRVLEPQKHWSMVATNRPIMAPSCFSYSWIQCVINCIKTFEFTRHFVEKSFMWTAIGLVCFLNMTSEMSQTECGLRWKLPVNVVSKKFDSSIHVPWGNSRRELVLWSHAVWCT